MRKLALCLIVASAALGLTVARADEAAPSDAAVDVQPLEATTDAPATDEGSTEIHVYLPPEDQGEDPRPAEGDEGSSEEPEVVVDPQPVDEQPVEDLPTLDVVDDQPVVVDEQPVVVDEQPVVVDGEKAVGEDEVTVDEDVVSEEIPVEEGTEQPLEGGSVPVEGGGTAELVTTTSTRGPEGCMECRTLTGVEDNLAAESPAPEITADVIDGNALPEAAPSRQSRRPPAPR